MRLDSMGPLAKYARDLKGEKRGDLYMEGFIQILSLLPIPLVAGMLCFVLLASFGILIAALISQKICNRLVRLIKAWRQRS